MKVVLQGITALSVIQNVAAAPQVPVQALGDSQRFNYAYQRVSTPCAVHWMDK